MVRKVMAVVALASLAGCAATESTARLGQDKLDNDADYMYAVESIARQKGVQVVWINPPNEEGVDYLSNRVK